MAKKKPAAAAAPVQRVAGPFLPSVIEHWPIAKLIPYARNARTHSPEQVSEIAGSIREFGWTNPVLVDETGDIIAGHGRVLAAHQLQMKRVPVIILAHLTDLQKRALRLADNRIALNAGWNPELLSLELRELAEAGYDTAGLGFAEDELTRLLADMTKGRTDPDDVPPVPANPVSQPGDLWVLGRHRLLCGDSTDPACVKRVCAGVVPVLMSTDPPYGVEYDPQWREDAGLAGKGIAKGKVKNDDTPSWLAAYRLFHGAVAYVWHASRFASIVEAELKDEICSVDKAGKPQPHAYSRGRCTKCHAHVGMEIRAQIIWNKQRGVISRGHYHWQHEPCHYAVRKGATATWHGDRKQTTVWDIPNTKNETGHGTQKPVECMKRPIENHTNPGQAVYDCFVGSGTTIIACEMTARCAIALELDPVYVDVGVLRWMAFTGEQAVLDGTGQTFAEVAAERGIELPA